MDERQKMIQQFMQNNPDKCSTHGGYETYKKTNEVLRHSNLPKHVGSKWNFRTQ